MLSVSNVRVRFPGAHEAALDCPELTASRGELVAVSGPSGCGKSTLGLAILGLLPRGTEQAGRVTFGDLTLSELPEAELRRVRGKRIAWVPQDVAASLSPFHTIARQLAEMAEVHEGASRKDAYARAEALLSRLAIADAGERMHEHPHRWSGGMLQRALVAMALMSSPELVIADEPTSALDCEARNAVAALMRERAAAGTSFLVITHDNALITALGARTVTLYRPPAEASPSATG